MSTKHLFLTLLAAFSLAFACQKPEANLSLPSIEISLTEAAVAEPASSFTVQVVSNRAWRVTSDVPWIAVDPDSGSGSMTGTPVTVTVMENTSFTRSGHVVFDIVYDNTTLTIAQAGNGSPEDFIIFLNDFDKETATQSYGSGGTSWPYLDQFEGWKNQTGVGIADLTYDFSNVSARNNSNSNGSFSDYAGSGLNNLLFGANGHIAVKNLDLKGFKKFRLSFGTEKYDNNDKTALFDPAEMPVYLSADGEKWIPLSYSYLGTAAGRWNVAEAFFSVPDDVTKLSVYVMATIASAYRLDDLKLEVPVEGECPVLDFSDGTDLPGGGGGGGGVTPGGDPAGTGTQADPYNVAAARNAVKDLTWTSNTEYQKTGTVYVKGKISRIADNGTYAQSGTFGNATFYISDDGQEGNELYCYRILYLENKKYTSGTDIKVGDDVVICGELMNYRGNTPETVSTNAYLYSLNGTGGGGGGGGDTPSGDPAGSGTLSDPYNPAGAANAVKDLTWTSNTEYQKTDKVYVKGKISRIASNGTFGESGTYGNASFYISADGTGDGEFYVFRTLYFGGEKYTSGTDIKVGDEVVIFGALMNYKGNTTETVANESWLYSLNGATDGSGGGGGGDTPSGEGSGTQADPYTPAGAANAVKDLTWTSNTEYQKTDKVYVKGKISRIASGGTYTESGTYGNASYYISADGSENGEFYIFRSLYFNGEKYTSGTDIKVGDVVVIYGALMNYRGNTPETVSGESWLYSLNGATDGSGGGGGGDTPGGSSVSFATNADAQAWAADTDGTYGSGYATTAQGLKIAYYKHTSSSSPVAPNANHVRVYKNSVLSIGSTDGKKIKKIVLGCAPDAGTTSYCFDMTGLEGGASATADKSAKTVTWTGSAAKVVLHANNGQVRMEKITVEFE